ncbi:MAG TPA: NADPH:quinone reductase [Methylomirabilota bacterium]|jgi:NADPH2:quinone reductase|nr:NADPH:quinone reductase [Methylomirabilota bacterium]
MKAIRVHKFGGPEMLQLEEVPDPKPGQGEALVRVHAAGVNPVETYVRSGAYALLPPLPYIPGGDGAGVVKAVGPGVTQLKVGDRVYLTGTAGPRLTGTYAELAVCEVAQAKPLPPSISFAQGAAVNVPYATAYRGLFHKARAVAGETVLVHGASGGVGVAAVQLANAVGLTVIGTAGTERGRKLVREQGAHHVLDHTASGYLDEIGRLTDGRGPDIVIENLANANLQKDLDVLARHGRIVVIGNRGSLEFNPRGAMSKDAVIYGVSLWNASAEELASIHAGLVAGLTNGTLRPVVGRELPLKDAAVAHAAVLEPGAYGKIVLIP